MYLSDEEQRILQGEQGDLARKSLKILVALGEIYGAENLLKINNVHSPGVSYRVTGDAGLNYVKEASVMGKFKVPVTLNSIGIDSDNWEEIGFPEDFSLKQRELTEAYKKMGAYLTNTCTPFLTGNIPAKGESVVWGESSAINFANSVLGARTNREGGPSALASAVTGRTPNCGYHLKENRMGKYLIQVTRELKTDLDYAVLGYFAGQLAGKEVPVITGITGRPSLENLKALSASVASSGAVALYHIVGITPEAPTLESVIGKTEAAVFGEKEYLDTAQKFYFSGDVDFVVLGCPHCSIVEFDEIAKLLEGKKVKADMWVCASKQVRCMADRMGYTDIIEMSGAKVVCDTCPVLCPTSSKGYKNIITNSVKLAHYVPGLWNVKSGLLETGDCIKAAVQGYWSGY